MIVKAEVWRGSLRSTPVATSIQLATPDIGITDCIECEGTGDWTRFHPDPDPQGEICVECKGTGRIYISV